MLASSARQKVLRQIEIRIQLFHSALNAKGRTGFVMANSASDARSGRRRHVRMLRSWRSPIGIGARDLKARHRHSFGVAR
jgi:hypothetical protein